MDPRRIPERSSQRLIEGSNGRGPHLGRSRNYIDKEVACQAMKNVDNARSRTSY